MPFWTSRGGSVRHPNNVQRDLVSSIRQPSASRARTHQVAARSAVSIFVGILVAQVSAALAALIPAPVWNLLVEQMAHCEATTTKVLAQRGRSAATERKLTPPRRSRNEPSAAQRLPCRPRPFLASTLHQVAVAAQRHAIRGLVRYACASSLPWVPATPPPTSPFQNSSR
jgi:hypothetical protein